MVVESSAYTVLQLLRILIRHVFLRVSDPELFQVPGNAVPSQVGRAEASEGVKPFARPPIPVCRFFVVGCWSIGGPVAQRAEQYIRNPFSPDALFCRETPMPVIPKSRANSVPGRQAGHAKGREQRETKARQEASGRGASLPANKVVLVQRDAAGGRE